MAARPRALVADLLARAHAQAAQACTHQRRHSRAVEPAAGRQRRVAAASTGRRWAAAASTGRRRAPMTCCAHAPEHRSTPPQRAAPSRMKRAVPSTSSISPGRMRLPHSPPGASRALGAGPARTRAWLRLGSRAVARPDMLLPSCDATEPHSLEPPLACGGAGGDWRLRALALDPRHGGLQQAAHFALGAAVQREAWWAHGAGQAEGRGTAESRGGKAGRRSRLASARERERQGTLSARPHRAPTGSSGGSGPAGKHLLGSAWPFDRGSPLHLLLAVRSGRRSVGC